MQGPNQYRHSKSLIKNEKRHLSSTIVFVVRFIRFEKAKRVHIL